MHDMEWCLAYIVKVIQLHLSTGILSFWPISRQGTKIILLDAADGKHTTNVTSGTDELETQVGAFLNDLIAVVRVLRWGSTWVPFDIGRYKLAKSAL